MLKLYNTLSRKKEVFRPVKPGFVGMYTCGITAYDHTHIGHMRTYVNTDLLRRVLEYNGFKVKHVENVTDVGHLFGDRDVGEDKIEATAKKAKKSAWEIARMYEKEFFETMDLLNVKRPTIVCRATEHIKEMIELVKRIEKNGFTYRTSDGIYFDTSKIKDYNKLSGMPLDKLKEGARVEVNPEKRNPTDFALWKFTPKGVKRQMEWESPWAKRGFPGWHIECSAMSMKYLGTQIDIHTGGEDHIPIHHTNERAQNIAAVGRPVVRFWIHNAFLQVEGQKMSKSLGNFFWMKDIKERGFNPLSLRYLFLTAHYRSRLNFTWQALKSAQNSLENLYEKIRELKSNITISQRTPKSNYSQLAKNYQKRFLEFINDDLNIPKALALMWKLVKDKKISPKEKYQLLIDFDRVFGLNLKKVKKIKIPKKVKDLVKLREKHRKAKDFKKADKIRKEIEKLGFKIEDTKEGPKIKLIHD